jgi:DNA-binding beta-propeller fold protein YncE
VAASPLGDRIFVAEGEGDKLVRVFDRTGNELTAFELPREPLEVRSPGAMVVGNDDRLYVIDSYQHELLMFDLDGEFIGDYVPDSDEDFEWFPTGVFLDDAGRLYITDQTEARHGVMIFEPTGELVRKFGVSGMGNGMFLFPTDIMVDDNGLIYVADSANSRIQVFDSEGAYVTAIHGTDLSLPSSLFLDGEGRLHVLDSLGHSVAGILLGDSPRVQFRYGALGRGTGEMYFPRDLTRDETGRIYVADRFNNRVQVWSF